MKKLINKIIVHIDKEKIKDWVKKKRKKFFAKDDYYICRVCKHVLPEGQMNPEDNSICKECAKH